MEFRKHPREILVFGLSLFTFIFLFLFLYRPFFLQYLTTPVVFRIAAYIAGFTGLLILSSYSIAILFFRKAMENWSLIKESIWTFGHFILIGSFNYVLITSLGVMDELTWFRSVYITSLVGLIPAGTDVLLRLNKSELAKPSEDTQTQEDSTTDLVYVRSEGNYIELYSQSEVNHELLRDVQRDSLKNFMVSYDHDLVQVHRSFLVNPGHVRAVRGNSNGGTIQLSNGLEVPFSRGYYRNVTPLKKDTRLNFSNPVGHHLN